MTNNYLGEILSPNYPNNYPHDKDEVWKSVLLIYKGTDQAVLSIRPICAHVNRAQDWAGDMQSGESRHVHMELLRLQKFKRGLGLCPWRKRKWYFC